MKKIFSLFMAVVMLITMTIGIYCLAYADVRDNFEYTVLENNTAEITKYYTDYSATLTIPSQLDSYTVTSIGCEAFIVCDTFTNVVIPNSVTIIKSNAFFNCKNLKSVTIPDSVTAIGDNAFSSCYSLTNVAISNSVAAIGKCCFAGCNNLKSIDVDSNNQVYCSVDGNLFTKDKTVLIQYAVGKNENVYTIPSCVEIVGDAAFCDSSSLMNVIIPESVTTIGIGAFSGADISNINIPNSVTSIGMCAFEECDNLTNVTIPSNITIIEDGMFNNCDKLVSVTIPNKITAIGKGAFEKCENFTDVYYLGTMDEMRAIPIGEYNAPLNNATIHCTDGDINEKGYSVSGSVVVMTNSAGDTNGVAVNGEYTLDVYSDAEKTNLITSVATTEAVNKNDVKVNSFTIDLLKAGTYYATLSSEYAITRDDITIVVTDSDIIASAIPILACDFNRDGMITGADAIKVYANASGEQAVCCDLNGDGRVTGADAITVYSCATSAGYNAITIK